MVSLFRKELGVDEKYIQFPLKLRMYLFIENGEWKLTKRGEEIRAKMEGVDNSVAELKSF